MRSFLFYLCGLCIIETHGRKLNGPFEAKFEFIFGWRVFENKRKSSCYICNCYDKEGEFLGDKEKSVMNLIIITEKCETKSFMHIWRLWDCIFHFCSECFFQLREGSMLRSYKITCLNIFLNMKSVQPKFYLKSQENSQIIRETRRFWHIVIILREPSYNASIPCQRFTHIPISFHDSDYFWHKNMITLYCDSFSS